MTLEEITARFPGGKWHGEKYETCCLAHDDRRASLGIARGERGGVVMCCQAGCATADVLAAAGLTLKDLAPPSSNGQHAPWGEIVAVYRYDDEQGNPLYEVCRTSDKQFPQRLPGAERFGIGETRRVLFGLPEMLQSPAGAVVGIAEGEKDVLNLRKHGLIATCNPGGASKGRSKWKQEYTDWLKQHLPTAQFLIFPDNDEAGITHAEAVLSSLRHAGLNVRVAELVGLDPGGDISDWLARHTDAEFQALVSGPPPKLWARLLSFAQLLEQPPPEWLIEGMFFEETMIEVFGEPNSGKSFVVIDEAIALRRGGEWCGRKIHRPGPVLYVNADGGRGFSDRARAWVEIHGQVEAPHEFWTLPEAVNLCRQQDMAELMALIRYLPECPVLVVFDTYSRCIPGVNENLQEFASMVVEHLDRLRLEFHASVKLVHHTDLSGQHARGSSVIIGACDTQARVEKSPDNIVSVTCEKQRDAAYFDPLYFQLGRIEGTNAVWITQREDGPVEDRSDRKESGINRVLEAIRRDPGITREALSLGLDIHERSIRRYVETLILRSQVIETDLPGEWLHRPPKGLFAISS